MELISWWVLNEVLTTLLVSVLVTTIVGAVAWRMHPRISARLLFVAIFSFSILGFVTGELMTDSREAAVGAVVPACLTLIGVVAGYVVSTKGVESQPPIFAMLICFPFALFVGSLFGIGLRSESESQASDPRALLQHDLLLENNKLAVELQRLENYVVFLQQRNGFSTERKLDLSRFESSYEKVVPGKQEPTGTKLQSNDANATSAASNAGVADKR